MAVFWFVSQQPRSDALLSLAKYSSQHWGNFTLASKIERRFILSSGVCVLDLMTEFINTSV
jgi:hypothetical protein